MSIKDFFEELEEETDKLFKDDIHLDEEESKSPDQLLKEYTGRANDIKRKEIDIEDYMNKYKEVFDGLKVLTDELDLMKECQENMKEMFTESMISSETEVIENKDFRVKLVKPTVRKDFDKKRFQAEHSEMYNSYLKEANVKGYVKITGVK